MLLVLPMLLHCVAMFQQCNSHSKQCEKALLQRHSLATALQLLLLLLSGVNVAEIEDKAKELAEEEKDEDDKDDNAESVYSLDQLRE